MSEWSAIARLPAEERRVLVLRCVRGFQVPEIALLLAMDEASVTALLKRAAVNFARALDEEIAARS